MSVSEKSEPVERKYSDFIWLHSQLRRDYPGLRLPQVPENNLDSVVDFMTAIVRNDLLAASHLTKKFCASHDEGQIKEFSKKRELMYPVPDGLERFKTFFSESTVINPRELELMLAKAEKLPDIVRSMNSDYDLFSESILETSTAISVFLGNIKSTLRDIEKAMMGVAEKFREISATTTTIITLLKRLNFAKTQFPMFDESHLNLDIIFVKLKNGFDCSGALISQSSHAAQPDRRIPPIYSIGGSTQKPDFHHENAAKNSQRQANQGQLTRVPPARQIKSIFPIFSATLRKFKTTS